jgi:hypothetical protein
VPLTLAAAAGALVFGHVDFGVTVALIIGSVPAVLVGSMFSSRAPDRYVRPVIAFAIFASGLKYVGVGTTALGWTLAVILVAGLGGWLVLTLARRRTAVPGPAPAPGEEASPLGDRSRIGS